MALTKRQMISELGFERVNELLSYDPETGILLWIKAGSVAGWIGNV
jgi:hypothetical protein